MDSQLLLLQTEKEDLLHQLDEESLRQDKVEYKAVVPYKNRQQRPNCKGGTHVGR